MTGESVPARSDGVIDPWLMSFWDKVFAFYPSLADVIPIREDEPWVSTSSHTLCHSVGSYNNSLVSGGRLPPSYTFHFLDNVQEKTDDRRRIPMEHTASSQSHPFPARLVSNKRVTDLSHFQDVRLIEFDITGSNIEWVMLSTFLLIWQQFSMSISCLNKNPCHFL